MKIGLLTLIHGYNYGGVLQCLSLIRALEHLGHEVEVIDFHPRPPWRRLRAIAGLLGATCEQKIVDLAGALKYGQEIHAKLFGFQRQYLHLSKSCNNRWALIERMRSYDAMIVGSDQVWNFEWFTPEYFFDFAQGYPGLLISYAACFGHANQSEVLVKKIGEWLSRFNGISVRNDFSRRLVYEACQREAFIAADPTLLVDLNDLALLPSLPCEQYILLYGLSEKRYSRSLPIFKKVKKELHLPIVAINSDGLHRWNMPEIDFIVKNPRIEEWLGLFKNASFVFTDSFHGTLYSIKNEIPFYNFIGKDSTFERVAYIAERYKIQQGFDIDYLSKGIYRIFEFDSITEAIQYHKKESIKFLKNNL